MKKVLMGVLLALTAMGAHAAPQAEYLNRGVVAVKTDQGVFVSWRSLVSDDKAMTFDIYRDGVKVNDAPVSTVTNFNDPAGVAGATYEVRATVGGVVVDKGECAAWETPYMKVHLQRPAGGNIGAPGQEQKAYTYTPDDVSVGDVDGDGVYELFVKWFPSNQKDSASTGYTGPTYIDCYKLDGTLLWRIDLGHNIRSGNHYTQFMVYDFDGDGSAELICKTAPGTKDGKGNWVLMGNDQPTDDYRHDASYTDKSMGHVMGGAEYLTCFSGKTGEELSTIAYKPGFDYGKSVWGDTYGNRADRYLAAVAYLDGQHPSAIFARGYYRAAFVWAVDFKDGQLKEVWFHESNVKGKGLWGEGAHGISVGDVDFDGKDEIVYGAACLDDDGTVLYRTNPNSDNTEGHGDALHLGKFLSDREGLQVFMPHEETDSSYPFNCELRDAKTGEIIFFNPQTGKDIGRGLCANVSPSFPGAEYWTASDANVYSYGKAIASNRPSINFRIYWDGDLLDECYDGTQVTKPLPDFSKINVLTAFEQYSNAASCNGTKATPNLQADLFGDWREEVILHDASTESDLLIFTTTIPTQHKLTCLMQDHQYRMAIAWQNVAYNQPPHLSYDPEEMFADYASLVVTSGAVSQALDINDPIEPIVVKAYRATGITVSELPEGLSWNYDDETATGTLSGSIAAEGDYTVTLTTTGAATESENAVLVLKFKVKRAVQLIPVAYYSMDDPGATLTNSVAGAPAAVLVGDNAPAKVEGKKAGAAEFDGTQYYAQKTYDNLQLGADDFTVEFWMKSNDDAAYILHKGSNTADAATGATGCWMGLELKNGVLNFFIDDDNVKSQTYTKDGAKYFDNEWHYIVAVRNAYERKLILYADGVEVASAQDGTGAIADNNEDLVIGNINVLFDNPFTGALDELTIYKGAMPAAKVVERYQTMGKELAYYPLDEVGMTTPNTVFGEAVAEEVAPVLVDGIKGGAAEFTGGAYYKQDAYDAVQVGNDSFTLEMWVNSTDDDGYLFFKGSHSANTSLGTTGCWIGLERKNGYLCFSIDDDKTKTDCKLADASAVFDGNWHHVACVRNVEDAVNILYVDGVEVARATCKTGAIADNNEPMMLGVSDETARTYDGKLDEVILHPGAMSAEDIMAAYQSLAGAGVEEITAADINARAYVVDAMSGVIVAKATGADAADRLMSSQLNAGVYLLVIDSKGKREVYKMVRR